MSPIILQTLAGLVSGLAGALYSPLIMLLILLVRPTGLFGNPLLKR
jgi:hypothetical protein